MIKNFLTGLLLATMVLLSGCIVQPSTMPWIKSNTAHKPLTIVTSFYPIYDLVYEIGGDKVEIKNLVPAGAEPHDYEPTPGDVVALNQADLIIYNGMGLEPWADQIIPELQKSGIKTMKLADLFADTVIHNGPQKPVDDEYLTYDPHFWMDPVNYQKEAEAVLKKLIELDPADQSDYENNAKKFRSELQNLNVAFENGFKSCRLQIFVTNHAAFAYLANRYHLKMISIAGVSPDSEPSAQAMAQLVKIIKQQQLRYILTESLVSPKIADVIASETGAKTLVLNPLEGLTDEEMAHGQNYITVMQENLQNLRTAMECE